MQNPSAAITTNKILMKMINFVSQFLEHAPIFAVELLPLLKHEQS